jgi:2-polyprenyl-3-methyl-5-hydroxy-6-metoxy-1,4-benzoquinol methylase
MTLEKYNSCTEYWLNVRDCTFRGEFESMYQDIEDPWGCEASKCSLNNQVFVDTIFSTRAGHERILDVGCGLGGLLSTVKMRDEDAYALGIDVSQTAVQKAQERYPTLEFRCHNILKQELQLKKFDLIILSEVLWYVLEDLSLFHSRVAQMMTDNGILAVHQYFPAEQHYGRNIVDGLSGYLNFIATHARFSQVNMFTRHHRDGLVLLTTFHKEK